LLRRGCRLDVFDLGVGQRHCWYPARHDVGVGQGTNQNTNTGAGCQRTNQDEAGPIGNKKPGTPGFLLSLLYLVGRAHATIWCPEGAAILQVWLQRCQKPALLPMPPSGLARVM